MDDLELCKIVHAATAGPLYPSGTHSGETMAVAKAVREACAKVADGFQLTAPHPVGPAMGAGWNDAAARIAVAIRNPN